MEQKSPLFAPVIWEGDRFRILDETLLPWEKQYITVTEVSEAIRAVKEMKTRAFGQVLTFLYSAALTARTTNAKAPEALGRRLQELADEFSEARPTFNFKRHTTFFDECLKECPAGEQVGSWIEGKIHNQIATILKARDGRAEMVAKLLPSPCRLMTHCNISGELVAIGEHCKAMGKDFHVIATETRPYLQGSRLTAWELAQSGIGVTLIPDSATAQVMSKGDVDVVLVGSDRCAQNGDIINKVGTYPLALMAKEYGIPFYALVQDPGHLPTGGHVPIEERPVTELFNFQGHSIAPEGVQGRYPAFDVTPAVLLSYLIRYDGVFTPDSFREKFQQDSVEKEIEKKEKKRLILLYGIPRNDDYTQLLEAFKDEQADGMLVPEIRPQLWGTQEVARELIQRGISTTLISDNMMGTFFAQEEIRRVYLFYHELDENGPVGICGSLLTARLAQVHGVPIKLLGSGETQQQPLDGTVATFMGQRVCPEEVTIYPVKKDRIPWSLLKNN